MEENDNKQPKGIQQKKADMYLYYIIIGVVSFISLVFLPMIGSSTGLGWNVPDTTVGWVVWVTTRLIVSTINVIIFHCFMEQAKLNVANNERYKEGCDILRRHKKLTEYTPKSPRAWTAKEYGTKGVSIFVSTGLATVAITQALLTFDYIACITYLFTIVMGILFGILQMKRAEAYWTEEFYAYAKNVEVENKKAEEQLKLQEEEAAKQAELQAKEEAERIEAEKKAQEEAVKIEQENKRNEMMEYFKMFQQMNANTEVQNDTDRQQNLS